MGTRAVSLELPDEVRAAIEETGAQSGRDFSSVASEMLSEAVRMRRFPGIVFVDSPFGRSARLEGTDTDARAVLALFNRFGGNRERLRQECSHLDEQQIETALAYCEAYSDEVGEQLDAELIQAVEAVWKSHPITKPPWR